MIKIYTYPEFKFIKELQGHSDAIWKLVRVNKSLIASSSDDKTIKLWDIESDILIHSFEGHIGNLIILI